MLQNAIIYSAAQQIHLSLEKTLIPRLNYNFKLF